ncbi:MAG: CCA tRNA nucleotidyltransferase [Planctomycetota bacterium]|nr:CCA tRNA nucleotidyltransferase [Planctomycetota bacterium]
MNDEREARAWRAGRAVLQALRAAGFQAWFVGGCVRDRLLGRPCLDIDLATDAEPEQVAALFPRCIDVGKRFRVMRVLWEGHDIEVATLRSDGPYGDGRHPESVRPGTLAEDAQRRDFTINALYEDSDGRILDPVGGLADLRAGVLRAIGDPEARFTEDRLRVLRALRLAAQLSFTIDPRTADAVRRMPAGGVARERILDELRKAASSGTAARFFALACELGRGDDIAPSAEPERAARLLERLGPAPLAVVLAAWLCGLPEDRWRAWIFCQPLSNAERALIQALLTVGLRLPNLASAERRRALRSPPAVELVAFAAADEPERLPVLLRWLAQESAASPCPLAARDLLALGYRPGPEIGRLLRALEDAWLSGSLPGRAELEALARCGLVAHGSTRRGSQH